MLWSRELCPRWVRKPGVGSKLGILCCKSSFEMTTGKHIKLLATEESMSLILTKVFANGGILPASGCGMRDIQLAYYAKRRLAPTVSTGCISPTSSRSDHSCVQDLRGTKNWLPHLLLPISNRYTENACLSERAFSRRTAKLVPTGDSVCVARLARKCEESSVVGVGGKRLFEGSFDCSYLMM